MTVNYYAFGTFPGGTPIEEGLHIGQSAQGSRFLFRAQPDQGLTTLADWLAFIDRDGVTIHDEAGRDVTRDALRKAMTMATDSHGAPLRARFRTDNDDRYVTSAGHAFYRREFS